MRSTSSILLAFIFSVSLPVIGGAQSIIHNNGETIFVSNNTPLYTTDSLRNNGGVVEVEGTLQVGVYSSMASSGSLVNTDTVWAMKGFELTGAGTYSGAGRLQFTSLSPNFNLVSANGFTADNLAVDFPQTTNIDFNFTSGGLTVSNGIELMGGGVVVSNGFIQDDNNALLTVDPGDTSFVSGVYRVLGVGEKIIPSGSFFGGSAQFREVRLKGVAGGPGTILAVQNFDGAGFSGSDSVGIANQFTGGDYYHVWEPSAGLLTGMDSLRLNTTAGDLSSIPAAGTRIAHSPTGNGEFQTVGSKGLSNSGNRKQLASETVIGDGTGWYIVARCQTIAGEAVAASNAMCPGEFNSIEVINEEGAFTYNWQQASSAAGPWTAVPSSPNADFLDLQDTLNNDLFFRVLYDDASNTCDDRATPAEPITISPALQARLRAMLQGPYHTAGDTMYSANAFTSLMTALQDTFEAPGPGNRMNLASTVADTMVDVVQVELWDATRTSILSSDSAWINSHGYLTDFKSGGSTPTVQFCGEPTGSYHVVIRHRNHLPLMSQSTISLNTTDPGVGTTYDMTQAANIYDSATNAIEIDVTPPTYGMIAGNATNPSWESALFVNAMDYFTVLYESGGVGITDVYNQGDIDIDGQVNAFEVAFVEQNVNSILTTTVPQ